MRPAVFEPTVPANERPHSYSLDLATTGAGVFLCYVFQYQMLRNASMSIKVNPCFNTCNIIKTSLNPTYYYYYYYYYSFINAEM